MENTNTNQDPDPKTPPPGRTDGDGKGKGADNEQVPFNEFKAVKDDMHRFKEESRKNAEALKALQEKDMRDKEQWKEYGQTKEKESAEWKSKYDTLSDSIREQAKIAKVKEAAIKLGLVDSAIEDLEMLDLKDVVVETTSTGRVNVIGAKSAAERIKSIRPHWFDDKRVPNVNGMTPEVRTSGAGSVTYADLQKLEADAKKTGDYKAYHAKLMEYKKLKK